MLIKDFGHAPRGAVRERLLLFSFSKFNMFEQRAGRVCVCACEGVDKMCELAALSETALWSLSVPRRRGESAA